MLLGFPTTCEFYDLDIFLVANKKNYNLLTLMMNSFDVFMPCYNHMHVFVDPGDIFSIESFLPLTKHNATLRVMDGIGPTSGVNMSYLGGYIMQDWLKIWSDYYVSLSNSGAKYVMFMDSDVVFSLPITRATLFDKNNKPYLAGWEMQHQPHFMFPCHSLLGKLCTVNNSLSYMTYYPIVFPLSIMAPMREAIVKHVRIKPNLGFDENFLAWAKREDKYFRTMFATFVVMGNFIKNSMPEVSRLIYTPPIEKLTDTSEAIDWIPSAIHHWYYSIKLSRVQSPYMPADLKHGVRYNPRWVALAEEVVFHGACIKKWWESKVLGLGCTEKHITEIHPFLKLYIRKEFNLESYKRKYYDLQ
eukprot:gene5344-7415_t